MGIDQPFLHVEDYYGEWKLDWVVQTDSMSDYTEEDILDIFSSTRYIGQDFSIGYDHVEAITWEFDTMLIDEDMSLFFYDGYYPPGYVLDWLSTKGKRNHRGKSYIRSSPCYLVERFRGWLIFFSKNEINRTTDFSNRWLQRLVGRWEVFDMIRTTNDICAAEEIKPMFNSPIEFTRDGIIDNRGNYHTAIFEEDSLHHSIDHISFAGNNIPEKSVEILVIIDNGYSFNKYFLSESGFLADSYDGWLILYQKQPQRLMEMRGDQ